MCMRCVSPRRNLRGGSCRKRTSTRASSTTDRSVSHIHCHSLTLYYTDIDRDGHEISCFGGLPREGKILPRGKIYLSWHHRHVIFHSSRSISVILDGQNKLVNFTNEDFFYTGVGVYRTGVLKVQLAELVNLAREPLLFL